jgi:hypothetical protein
MTTRVSLAELTAANIKLRPAEAVAIVSTICAQRLDGALPGIPTPGVVRLSRGGEVLIEGPVATTQDDVARAAHLLDALLPGFDALPEYRASGALRLVIARALRTLDLPPYGSLVEFRTALQRFAAQPPRESVAELFRAWERARAAHAFREAPDTGLTISDVRRARRATGLSIDHVAAVAELPRVRVRDLEWGDLRSWPADADGRAQIIRYARAAGLDETLVLSIAWPMVIETVAQRVQEPPCTALVPVGSQALTTVAAAAASNRHRRWRAAAGIAAAAILLVIGTWDRQTPPRPAVGRPEAVQVGLAANGAPPVVIVPRAMPAATAAAAPMRDRTRRPAAAAATPRRNPRKVPLLQRELIRLEFR